MIPDATIRLIQDRLDIVEVISGYMTLRRSGKNFKANCPFHGEKTPSFMVSADKQIFHCFGCGAGGNVFGFVMKIEKKDFRETVEALAERAGVELPKDVRVDPKTEERISQLFGVHAKAVEFYHQGLLSKKEAAPARAYLEKRGLSPQTIQDFKLGYAPGNWDAFYASVKGQIPEAVLEKSGLVLAKKEGGFYDRFRNRILFPIFDAKGACIAFGGRVMDDSLPKYLNSPETEIYSKGRQWYGLFQARKAIRDLDAVVVVEGYMDLISCHQAGVQNVVASLGTALTTEQARVLKRHTQNVFIVYDADKAGESATLRGLEILIEEGMEVKIVRLPEGEDPDSFVRKKGAGEFGEALKKAKNLFDYKLDLLKQKFDVSQIEGKVKIANDLVSLFSRVKNEILRSAWTKALAQELSLSEEALLAEMKKSSQRPGSGRLTAAPTLKLEGAPRGLATQSVTAAERMVLGLSLEGESYLERARQELRQDDFKNPVAQRIARQIFESLADEKAPTAASLMSVFAQEPEVVGLLSQVSADVEILADKEKVFTDCLVQMKRQRIRQERGELLSQIATAESIGDQSRINEFMGHLHELNQREKKINEKK